MRLHKFIHKDYTTTEDGYQLSLPFELNILIPDNDSVRLVRQFVEGMNLKLLYQSYSRIEKKLASPKQMLQILLYAYMNRVYSSRAIAKLCKRDINFMYLLQGKPAPNYSTIARFRTKHFGPVCKELFASHVGILSEMGELSLENIFIDGTKLESSANKYTFVWKKAVIKNNARLLKKIEDVVNRIHAEFELDVTYDGTFKVRHLRKLLKVMRLYRTDNGINFVKGSGKRKSTFQKYYEELRDYTFKLNEYANKLHICGNRNSYSKTDHDATFMRMKEDAMRNGQLKPGYNIQFGVDAQYVVWVTQGPQPTDTTTLIPFLNEAEDMIGRKYINVVADAGYESEENYRYLEANQQIGYIKTSNYEILKTRKFKNDVGARENMPYNPETDSYTCANGKQITYDGIRRSKSKTGYLIEKACYSCKECAGCPCKFKCIKGNNSKTPMEQRSKHFEVSKYFQEQRKLDLERITSEKGKLLRMNRSIQAEGAFGDVKADMRFRRFLCKGQYNILAETMLLAMGRNIKKLHNKIQAGTTGIYLFDFPVVA